MYFIYFFIDFVLDSSLKSFYLFIFSIRISWMCSIILFTYNSRWNLLILILSLSGYQFAVIHLDIMSFIYFLIYFFYNSFSLNHLFIYSFFYLFYFLIFLINFFFIYVYNFLFYDFCYLSAMLAICLTFILCVSSFIYYLQVAFI